MSKIRHFSEAPLDPTSATFRGSPTLVLAALSISLLWTSAIAAEFPTFPKNTSYKVVRARLLKGGYTPVIRKGECGNDNRCKLYPEADACSGTGMGYCNFVWRAPNGAVYSMAASAEDVFAGATCLTNCQGKSGPVDEPSRANAVPWQKHPDLSWPTTPLTVQTSAGPEDIGTTKDYFDRYAAKNIICEAEDGRSRNITITCRDPVRQTKTVYMGGFVGAGYLVVDHIAIDGRALDPLEMVEHMKRVAKQGPENR